MKAILERLPKNKTKIVKTKSSSHVFVNGDSSLITKDIPDNSIDLIFADPPYNAGLNYGDKYNDKLSWEEYRNLSEKWFKEYRRILKNSGSLYVINYPEINAYNLLYLRDKVGLKFRRWITWHAPTNIGHSKKNFTRSQRSILFFTKSDKYTFNREEILQPYKNEDVGKIKERIKKGYKGRGAYDALSVLDLVEMRLVEESKKPLDFLNINLLKNVSKDRLNKKHPCQLPFELIERLIKVSTKPGEIVLDPFAGTFSTSFVSSNSERDSIGIELNPKFIKLGLNRINDQKHDKEKTF